MNSIFSSKVVINQIPLKRPDNFYFTKEQSITVIQNGKMYGLIKYNSNGFM